MPTPLDSESRGQSGRHVLADGVSFVRQSADEQNRLGSAVAPQWVIALVVLVAISAAVLVARGIRQHGVTVVVGVLEAESIVLRSAFPGVVVELSKTVGDIVTPGETVATLRPEEQRTLVELERSLADIEQEYEIAVARYDFELGSKTREIDGDLHALEMQTATLKGEHYAAEMERIAWRDALDGSLLTSVDAQDDGIQQLGYSSSVLDEQRVVEVFGEGDLSPVGLSKGSQFQAIIHHERAAARADACESQVELCEKRLAVLTEQRTLMAKQFKKTIGLPAIEESRKRLNQQIGRYGAVTELSSPAHGMVIRVSEPGTECDDKTCVVELADNARRRVIAVVPPRVAVNYAVGDRVELVFPTGDKRFGTLAFIAPSGTDGVSVAIVPAGKRWPRLSLGCHVDATFR